MFSGATWQSFCCNCSCFNIFCLLLGFDAVSDDGRYVGGENHRVVCRAQRHRQVGLCGGVHICRTKNKGSVSAIQCPFFSSTIPNYPHRDEAEMEYLKIAQDLEMYGVSYFAITVRTLLLWYFSLPTSLMLIHTPSFWSTLPAK